eukprot:6204806-Pleurochrysis_carterae.AAC.2
MGRGQGGGTRCEGKDILPSHFKLAAYEARVERWRHARLPILQRVADELIVGGRASCVGCCLQLRCVDHLDLGKLLGVDRR